MGVEERENESKAQVEARREDAIAGNPAAIEAFNTSLQLEGVDAPHPEGATREGLDEPISLLPDPVHLDSHPADSLHPPDSPTTSLISSLRSQLSLLSEQSHQLNSKLVASISRHSDLEDTHYALQHQHKVLGERTGELEKGKKQWEESMNTGLLVERSQIRDEMQRLAQGLVEEERRRGSAEEKRWQVEGEVDALTASLFDQANTMVATERMGRVVAEERLKSTEDNLAAAEAAVRDMQLHLQSLPTTAVASSDSPTSNGRSKNPRRYLSSHVPYAEFITFLQHLRALRPLKDKSKDMFPAPLLTSLMAQPFIARAINEDHEPTVRLDAAPDLSWLTRKGISQAIISGDLIIEPVSASTILAHSSSSIDSIGCSLCGKPVFAPIVPQSPSASHFGPPPPHPTQRQGSSSRFSLKPFFNASGSPSQAIATSSPTQSPLASPGLPYGQSFSSSVYIFRLVTTQSSDKESRSYPLCKTGWCLERLRATCDLWHIIRTGIIHVVWQGDDGYVLASEASTPRPANVDGHAELEPRPQEVVRRKSAWGLGFKLAGSGSEKSGSGTGSWSKAFSRSLPPSPGVEKANGLPEVEAVKEEGGGEHEVKTEDGGSKEKNKPEESLGAPLELEEEKGNIKNEDLISGVLTAEEKIVSKNEGEVPTIQEINPSPSVPTTETIETPPIDVDAGNSLQPAPQLRRGDSVESFTGTDDGVSFSTPKGQNTELPEENGVTALALPVSTSSTDVVDLNSPKPDTSPSRIARRSSKSPSKRDRVQLPPPPIPKRAAARSRVSLVDEGSSSTSSLDKLSDVDRAASPLDETPALPTGDGVEGKTMETKEAKPRAENENENGRRSSLPPRPPLPARQPKTPTSQVSEQMGEGQKIFLSGDAWEVRTWKQVIRLKEEIWRARVGVVDVSER